MIFSFLSLIRHLFLTELVFVRLNDYLLALDSYNIDKENMLLSQSIEEKNSIKFFEGMVSSFELRQAQNQLLNAQQKYLNSVINLISINAELETLFNKPITLK